MTYTATYDPADDKLRLSATSRLDAETYARVKAAGFSWAPKQGVFYAVWSPGREDLLIEMAGEIGDEDTSIVERAEERAERFDGYRENRTADANQAHAAVSAICEHIPMGQPILVGHHSERHARRDAEKIENGMRRAVKMWETAHYWQSRAAGAIRHAKYKERPDVRARRIKGLEADLRSQIASYTPHPGNRIMQQRWNDPKDAPEIPHVYVGPKGGRGGNWVAEEDLPRIKAQSARWEQHIENRLLYERAMLAEGGGLVADQFNFEVGGQVTGGRDWYVITGLNRKDGRLLSLSVIGRWCSTLPIEEVKDYRAPADGDAEKVKAVKKLPPLVNFRAAGCVEMTTAEWKQRCKWSDSYFVGEFTAEGVYNSKYGSERKVSAYRLRTASGKDWVRLSVFLTDAKVVDPPKSALTAEPVVFDRPAKQVQETVYREPEPTVFDAMKESIRAGVQVVSAPQLFPTPPELAARMVEEAEVKPEHRVLEPSAGTGRIVDALDAVPGASVTAVEVSHTLADNLRLRCCTKHAVIAGDFLEQNGNLGKFDRVLMNPPFADGADIEHVRHAFTFLKPGGRLVAIMCEGPFFRQDRKATEFRSWLVEVGGTSEQLPQDTFESSGTGVQTRLVVIDR